MITVLVPTDHPLTNSQNAVQVFVVKDQEGEVFGVYPSDTRALSYIKDWVFSAKDLLRLPRPWIITRQTLNHLEVLVDDVHEYNIVPTYYRY